MKFDKTTHAEALAKAETVETWVVEGIISRGSTLLYGEAKVGKSFLASALIAGLVTNTDFLGRKVPQDREFSVAVCWTDDGGDVDYATQVDSVLPDGHVPAVEYYCLPIMKGREDWNELFNQVMNDGHNFVVIDNLTQCLNGSFNNDDVVREFFDGVRMFTRAGIPVVIIGHSTDKVGITGGKSDKPMGSATISQSVRWKCFVKRSRKGNLVLEFSGNHAKRHEITVKHGAGARFEVVGSRSAEELEKAASDRQRQRDAVTLDRNAEMARWLAENGQGMGVREASRALAEQFGGSENTYRTWLRPEGKLGKLLYKMGHNPLQKQG